MKKNSFLVVLALLGGLLTASSQTLFTYGDQSVDVNDFLKAYTKNNIQPVTDKNKSIRDYLDLYIKSRLKVKEAYAKGLDTLPSLVSEVNNLRTQIIDKFMTDPVLLTRLQAEAFARSQKDIHVAHIFIPFKNASGVTDTVLAGRKRDEVLARLKKGEDFSKLAVEYSGDPAVKTNKGDIGFITVFILPYEFENAVYATAPGKYSAVVRSKMGYHIFKNIGERKAAGKIKVQQILLAFPPGADEATRQQLGRRADSIYQRLKAGDDFAKLATAFSNDYISAATGGNIPDVGVGQYDPVFENAVWALPKDGVIGKPFVTSHGWHIVKRVSIKPIVSDPKDRVYQEELQQKIMTDGRWKSNSDFIYVKVINKAGYRKLDENDDALWAYSDSLLDMRPMAAPGRTISGTTPLFSIGGLTYDVDAWIKYARVWRFKPDGTGVKPYPDLREEWVRNAMKNYYRDHLEDFSDEFKSQMAEFKEGNMFFEIMQEEVWNKAQADSVALEKLFNQNRDKYTWKQSADAVIFFCSDAQAAKSIYAEVKQKPADWQRVTDKYNEKVMAESSRYEWSQIPNLNKMVPHAGMLTTPLVNTADNTASFAYIIKSYPNPMPRSFSEAKGLVINDYQELLEKQWDEALKKKYPVVINQQVLDSITK